MTRQWTPHPYQLRGLRQLLGNTGAGLFLDPGMGKTSTTLAYIQSLKDAGQLKGALVVAPLRPAHEVWPREIEKWDDFATMRYEVLHGPRKTAALDRPADVYIINYEGLGWLEDNLKRIRPRLNVLVLDESTRVKNHTSQRFLILRRMIAAKVFDRRVILTGTPRPNSLLDLFAQVYMLDGGERLGRYITHYRRRYFNEIARPGRSWSEWVPKEGADADVTRAIGDIVLTLQAEDYLDMPAINHVDVRVPVDADVMDMYRDFAREYMVELRKTVATAANAAVLGNKLRQLLGGSLYVDGKVEVVHTAKADALAELVEELQGNPLLVGVGFRHEVDLIRRVLGYKVPYIGGGESTKAVKDAIGAWNAGRLPVLLAHPASVAHGLNLQAGGHHICWYTLSWNLEEYEQLNRRLYRQGQSKPVFVHTLMVPDTIDNKVAEVLRAKGDRQKALLKALTEVPT